MTANRILYAAQPLLIIAPFALAFAVSCNSGKTVEPVLTQTDTLRVTDTLHAIDTVRIATGKPGPTCFGLLVGDILVGDSVTKADSIYAYLSVTANPPLRALSPTVNGHDLVPSTDLPLFVSGISYSAPTPDLASSAYSGRFSDGATEFTYTVPVPYYANDSTSVVSYDSLTQSISLPSIVDSLILSNDSGIVYDSVDFFLQPPVDSLCRRIPLDRDLFVSWTGAADWFAIECSKYTYDAYYGQFNFVGTIRDTVTTSHRVGIPKDYLYQDTTAQTTQYDALYVTVIAFNGPAPGSWDSLSDFQGRGYLLAMRDTVTSFAANASPVYSPQGGVGKRKALFGSTVPRVRGLDILARVRNLYLKAH